MLSLRYNFVYESMTQISRRLKCRYLNLKKNVKFLLKIYQYKQILFAVHLNVFDFTLIL